MKTAEDYVQEFLFADKPKRSYCKKFDFKDLVSLLNKFSAQQSATAVAKRERQLMRYCDLILDEDHPKGFYQAVHLIYDQLNKPTSAEIAQVEPTIKVSDLQELINKNELLRFDNSFWTSTAKLEQFINSKTKP